MQSRMIVTVAVMNATKSGCITPCTTIMPAKVIAVNIYIYILRALTAANRCRRAATTCFFAEQHTNDIREIGSAQQSYVRNNPGQHSRAATAPPPEPDTIANGVKCEESKKHGPRRTAFHKFARKRLQRDQ